MKKSSYQIILFSLFFTVLLLPKSFGQTSSTTIDLSKEINPNSKLLLGISYDCRSSLSDPTVGLLGYHNTDGTFISGINTIFNDFPMAGLRYPGNGIGNGFEWHKSVGTIESRTPQILYPSAPAQVMEFGFDEFMKMTEERGVNPRDVQIMVPIYDKADINLTPTQLKAAVPNMVQSNADWVEYCNAPNDGTNPGGGTDWAAMRAANGHPAPYGIEIWNMGNEPYTAAEYDFTGVDDYITTIVPIIDAMLAIDPSIKITITVLAKTSTGNWTDVVLNSPQLMGKIYGVNNHFFLSEVPVGSTVPSGVAAAESKLIGVAAGAAAKGYKLIVGDHASAIDPLVGATQAQQDIAMQWQGANLTADFILMMSQISNIERSNYWVYGSPAAQWHPIRKNADGSFTLMPTADLYKRLTPVFLDNSIAVVNSSPAGSDGNTYSVRSSAFASTDKSLVNVVSVNRDKADTHTLQINGIAGYTLQNSRILTAPSLASDVIIENAINSDASGFYVMPPMSVLILEYSNVPETTLGNLDIGSREILYYPNPVNQTLNFTRPGSEVKAIYTISGLLVRTSRTGESSMNVGDLADGVYVLKSGRYSEKIVIKH
jgi:alpha-L-arabinofuranosidase